MFASRTCDTTTPFRSSSIKRLKRSTVFERAPLQVSRGFRRGVSRGREGEGRGSREWSIGKLRSRGASGASGMEQGVGEAQGVAGIFVSLTYIRMSPVTYSRNPVVCVVKVWRLNQMYCYEL